VGRFGHRVRAHIACRYLRNVLVEGQDLLLQPALAEYRRMVQPWLVDVPMALSTIPQTAGILGAAALVFSCD